LGTVAALLHNINRNKNKRAIAWSDIFPPYEARRTKSPDELLSVAVMLNEAFGGTDLRDNKTPPTA
jgi:hypothetical protein